MGQPVDGGNTEMQKNNSRNNEFDSIHGCHMFLQDEMLKVSLGLNRKQLAAESTLRDQRFMRSFSVGRNDILMNLQILRES